MTIAKAGATQPIVMTSEPFALNASTDPLHGRLARLEFARAVAPLVVWFASASLAFVFGLWTIVVWCSVWPSDSWLVRLEQRSSW